MLASPGIEDRREDPQCRIKYDREEKQLTIIAVNLTAQDELGALAAVMRHGDVIAMYYFWIDQCLHLEDEIKRRFGEFKVKVKNSDMSGLGCFLEACQSRAVYLWAGEESGDGWNTLVFGHE